jgi:hypothetical protein
VLSRLARAGITGTEADEMINLLLWYGFLGVGAQHGADEPRYAYELRYDLRKLLFFSGGGEPLFVVHPMFRAALETATNGARG